MKVSCAALLLLIASLLVTGCETDVAPAPTQESGTEKLRRGLTGQGAIVQPDRSEDPLIREESRVGY